MKKSINKDYKERFITAHEIHQFFYCPYAWWYELSGKTGEQISRLEAGKEFHREQNAGLEKSQRLKKSSNALLIIGGCLLIAFVVFIIIKGLR